mmetsp:Transcript_11391/g.47703  ORF Transcript_11391/g.47703 Transcript_11391/m.47703 type:complete len:313 (-) Transcript_11391:155-1093(-)
MRARAQSWMMQRRAAERCACPWAQLPRVAARMTRWIWAIWPMGQSVASVRCKHWRRSWRARLSRRRCQSCGASERGQPLVVRALRRRTSLVSPRRWRVQATSTWPRTRPARCRRTRSGRPHWSVSLRSSRAPPSWRSSRVTQRPPRASQSARGAACALSCAPSGPRPSRRRLLPRRSRPCSRSSLASWRPRGSSRSRRPMWPRSCACTCAQGATRRPLVQPRPRCARLPRGPMRARARGRLRRHFPTPSSTRPSRQCAARMAARAAARRARARPRAPRRRPSSRPRLPSACRRPLATRRRRSARWVAPRSSQ